MRHRLQQRHRRLVILALLASAGCAATDASIAPPTAGAATMCVVDSKGEPLTGQLVAINENRVMTKPDRELDARGCIEFEAHPGLYTAMTRAGYGSAWFEANVRATIRVGGGGRLPASYRSGERAAELDRLIHAGFGSAKEQDRAIDSALASRDPTIRLAGLLAGFDLAPFDRQGRVECPRKHSPRLARELLAALPRDSPLLEQWPTGILGATLALPDESPWNGSVEATIREHPDPNVGATLIYALMQRAAKQRDLDTARALYLRLSEDRFAHSWATMDARLRYTSLAPGPKQDDPAPDWSATDIEGERVALASMARPTLLYFWSSYCTPCRDGPEKLAALQERYGDNLRIISISIDDEREPADEFRAEYGPFPGTQIDTATNPELRMRFGVEGVPHTILFAGGETILRGAKWERVLERIAALAAPSG